MLAVSRASLPTGPRCDHVQADIRRLPIVDRGVDLVFCHRLLNHLTRDGERRQALAELARVCGRVLIVSALGPLPTLQRVREAYDQWRGTVAAGSSRYVTTETLTAELAASGMHLQARFSIRRFPMSAAFLVFGRS